MKVFDALVYDARAVDWVHRNVGINNSNDAVMNLNRGTWQLLKKGGKKENKSFWFARIQMLSLIRILRKGGATDYK